jgi:uncharacterized membrane protein YfhO
MKKKYFISGLVVAVILLIVFLVKWMYPFGKNYIMWGDMYEQIVPMYYNFYDVIRNGKSYWLIILEASHQVLFLIFQAHLHS